MTSNQIGYAQNKISQQMADETVRHNETTEAEITRHNATTENLQMQSNSIEQQKADEIERHNRETERIGQAYNDAYIKLQTAQGDERLRIQDELAQIERSKAEEVARHNGAMEMYNTNLAEIERYKAEEVNRHNEATESNAINLANLQERQTALNERLGVSQALYWNGVLSNERTKINTQDYHSSVSNLLDMYGLKQRMLEWETNKKQVQSQTFRNYFNAINDSLSTLTKTISIGVLR